MYSLVHQQCLPQIPSALLRYSLMQPLDDRPALLLGRRRQNITDLVGSRRSYANEQSPRPNWCNNICRRVGQEDQAQIWRVFLHRSPQRCLRVSGEVVGLVDDHDLESLFGGLVDLLSLGHLLQEILYHDSVVVTNIGRRDLEVVDRGDDVEFEFAVACGLENACVDLDLLDSRTIELFQCGYDPCLLASSRGAVDEKVREISTLGLCSVSGCFSSCVVPAMWGSYK